MTRQTLVARTIVAIAVAAGLASNAFHVLAAPQAQDQDAQAQAIAKLLDSRACERCDLSGARFDQDMNLRAVDLAGAKLSSAFFYRTDLTNANFSDADLTKANLSMANLTNANFANANLDGANLAGSTGASLAGVKTTETTVCPDGQAGPCR